MILEKSLSGFQIEQLQRISVQARFPTAEKPFQDREVLSYCGASDKERDDLNKLIKDLGADLYKRLSVARTNSIEELGESLRLLNPTQMKALVNLVGNKFFPEIALEEDSLDESIPFPSKVRSIFLLNCLVDDRELQKFLRLSDSQINKLVEIYAHFDQSQRESKGPTGLFERSSNEMLAVLNPTQKQGVLRSLMSYEFENDFVSVLGDPKVVAYLKLSEADESALKLLAETAAEKLKSKRSEINKAFFERLCESLSPKCGKIMRSLFGDCW
ncbi:MAG: hypothetical protein NTY15_11130 [Planctomycetota bacterium]|nr:hypothetical protein [Planctomycetota bacterium]